MRFFRRWLKEFVGGLLTLSMLLLGFLSTFARFNPEIQKNYGFLRMIGVLCIFLGLLFAHFRLFRKFYYASDPSTVNRLIQELQYNQDLLKSRGNQAVGQLRFEVSSNALNQLFGLPETLRQRKRSPVWA